MQIAICDDIQKELEGSGISSVLSACRRYDGSFRRDLNRNI